MGFITDHALWTPEQTERAADCLRRIEADRIESVRIGFPDLHGIMRGKTVMADALDRIFSAGLSITSSLLLKDSSHRTVGAVFSAGAGIGIGAFAGAADMVLVPDPFSFRILPWANRTAWLLCDCYLPDGSPVELAPRHQLRRQAKNLADRDLELVAGLEVEFHLFRLDDPMLGLDQSGQPGQPPAVSLSHQGYNYLTELRYDTLEPILEILRATCAALDLPLRSIEIEFGPSQVEFVFGAGTAERTADDMILFRSAIKQVCRRHGYHATFMCRPAIANVCSSGWHLHQSLRRRSDRRNLFAVDEDGDAPLSRIGLHYLAGLLRDASAAMPFAMPTVNGYKRIRPMSLAPDRAVWGRDNRGAMLRVLQGTSSAARIENRAGEPAANPYLYVAAQIISGLSGIDDALDPGPGVETPYDNDAAALPTTLEGALALLAGSERFARHFGEGFVRHFLRVKQAEVARFNLEVSTWEQKEYFDMF
ncbi:glutamine synthetase family protein [Acetobacteraceae bacterium KSS8]|uniref:Glutamine synthetase family protein n=1 Tax=Endosaccharibacter trunci TaxID=2812733 RepID=A0ABT1WB47_9PROT|nr:glutamine synthetase family protein [Acetobacteraceae bacterium KSS8]